MLPIRFILRHPVQAYRHNKITKAEKLLDKQAELMRQQRQNPDVTIKNTTALVEHQQGFLRELRKSLGRELTAEELKVFEKIIIDEWPSIVKMREGIKLYPKETQEEIKKGLNEILDEIIKGKTPDEIYEFIKNKKSMLAATAVVATQSPAVKPYEDASSSSFKTKKDVYDSIPSTRSSGVMSRASNPETFKNGVVNMARTMDASANQISKLLKMDAKLLEELYYDKPFLFDLYFEYSLYDDFGASHEDSGINKLIESYEYKYGVTL